MVKISVVSYQSMTGVKNILPGAMAFCLQFQLLGLELHEQPVPLAAGNRNDLSSGTESRSRQAVTRPRAAAERTLIQDEICSTVSESSGSALFRTRLSPNNYG